MIDVKEESDAKDYYFNNKNEFITHLYGNIWLNVTTNKLIFNNNGSK